MARISQYKALGTKLGGYKATLSKVQSQEYAKAHADWKAGEAKSLYGEIGGSVANILGIIDESKKLKAMQPLDTPDRPQLKFNAKERLDTISPDALEDLGGVRTELEEDFGREPEEFDELELMKFLDEGVDYTKKPTNGIFAPWAIYKDDFTSIGGHDPLYAPQSKEDSDIFNRFKLNGYELIQTWRGFVYHMTCRGSRFKDGALRNPAGQVFMKGRESSEWLAQNLRSTRNFIRKWGHMVNHDALLHPIIPPKYDVGFVVENCDTNMLKQLEPWCSDIYGDWVGHKGFGVNKYIEEEQPDTQFDLKKKIHSDHFEAKNNVIVEFDCQRLTPDNFQILVNLSEILQQSGEVGEMELEIFKFKIKSLDTYEKGLIKVE